MAVCHVTGRRQNPPFLPFFFFGGGVFGGLGGIHRGNLSIGIPVC